ncbi:hypothetical protein CHS0354_041202 [Potamilus streckersoni]|uniref:Uncharacterized protein n=1 Tax=Potamilus streckersoni TaxID=2493646 RepID=A0AAE0VUY4_9BIVA|nr:hypothetical protein CHS0354_041202 [Potamilus streckersoni]
MQRLMTILNKPPADIDEELATRCVNLAAAVIAWKFFTEFTETIRNEEKMILMAATKCAFNMAWNADALAGKLQVATFHFLHKEYVQALSILDSAVSATSVLCYPAWCSKLRFISVTNGTIQQSAEGPSSFKNVGVAFDVMFTKENIQHVPYAIQFECALLGEANINFALFHPLVYAFYLLFEVHCTFVDTRKRDEYILHLSNIVHSTEGGLERHHALNILGVCFQKMENLHEAFSRFSQSLKECQNKANAAVYHLVILAFQCLRDRRFDWGNILSLEGFNCHQNNNWEVSKRHVVIYRRDPGFQ